MKEYILIDFGSSSIKVYLYNQSVLTPLLYQTIPLKDHFDPVKGFSSENEKKIFHFLQQIRETYPHQQIHIYATALFRQLSSTVQIAYKKRFEDLFQMQLRVVTHDQENKYLELALLGKFLPSFPVLLINIGGGSTELVVVTKNKKPARFNSTIGVGTLLHTFPGINEQLSAVSIQEVVGFCLKQLPPINDTFHVAFYTGGELLYMEKATYALEKNTFFTDLDHPLMISFDNFKKRNKEIFSQVPLSELENMMPENPQWMHGARACSAFAQAICEKYAVQSIIPSNANLINGIIRKEFSS